MRYVSVTDGIIESQAIYISKFSVKRAKDVLNDDGPVCISLLLTSLSFFSAGNLPSLFCLPFTFLFLFS